MPCANNSSSHDLEVQDALASDVGVGEESCGHEDALPYTDNTSGYDLEVEDARASDVALEKESYGHEDAFTCAGNM